MKLVRKTALALAMGVATVTSASAAELTIAIVNNGHMINMQKVAEAYTEETGTKLNWVSLEEGVLREQVTSDTATGGGEYDIINIGMQEAVCRKLLSGVLQAGLSHWNSALSTTLTICCLPCATACLTKALFTLRLSMVSLQWLCTVKT